MSDPRDIAWGVVLGAALVIVAQAYPQWRAQRTAIADAEQAFAQVFEGRRMADGTLISPSEGASTPQAFTPPIYFHRVDVEAADVEWNGKQASFLLKHIIGFDETLDALNPTHEVWVRMERQGGEFVYTQFQVRGLPTSPGESDGNPWFPLMHAAAGAERHKDRSQERLRSTDVAE
jgi:hypothetical protein